MWAIMHYRDRIPIDELKRYAAAMNTRAKAARRPGTLTAETLRGVILDSGGHCRWCGMSLVGRDFEIDHIMPLRRGGDNVTANLVLACAECNRRKGEKSPLMFAQEQSARGIKTRLIQQLLDEAGVDSMQQRSLFGDDDAADSGQQGSGWVYTPPDE